MAGGIAERPFSLNAKCIVLSLVVGGAYWWLPPKSLWVLLALFWISYVGLSWYDELYDCSTKMKPTLFPMGRLVFLPFKPQSYKDEFKNLSPRQIQIMDRVDHLASFTSVILVLAVLMASWHVHFA